MYVSVLACVYRRTCVSFLLHQTLLFFQTICLFKVILALCCKFHCTDIPRVFSCRFHWEDTTSTWWFTSNLLPFDMHLAIRYCSMYYIIYCLLLPLLHYYVLYYSHFIHITCTFTELMGIQWQLSKGSTWWQHPGLNITVDLIAPVNLQSTGGHELLVQSIWGHHLIDLQMTGKAFNCSTLWVLLLVLYSMLCSC